MKHLFILLSFFYCTAAIAQFDEIDHFYVSSPKAEELYNFFKNNFQLPIAWKYESHPEYSSGAVSLGNVPMEFVKFNDSGKTRFEGLGLKPHETLEKMIADLDSKNILHDTIESFGPNLKNGKKDTIFEIVTLKGLAPANVNLFMIDYKSIWGKYERIKKKASDSLPILQRHTIGITSLREIVIGCKNVTSTANELSKLPGIKREKNNLFTFASGPSIKLEKSNDTGIVKIVINVTSLNKAKAYLQSKNLLGRISNKSLFTDPNAIDGLKIELVEK